MNDKVIGLTEVTWGMLEPEIRRLVAANPYFIYPEMTDGHGVAQSCFYTSTHPDNIGGVACIFGQALANLGVPVNDLESCEHVPIEAILSHPSLLLFDRRHWCQELQQGQDAGLTWGRALWFADDAFPVTADA